MWLAATRPPGPQQTEARFLQVSHRRPEPSLEAGIRKHPHFLRKGCSAYLTELTSTCLTSETLRMAASRHPLHTLPPPRQPVAPGRSAHPCLGPQLLQLLSRGHFYVSWLRWPVGLTLRGPTGLQQTEKGFLPSYSTPAGHSQKQLTEMPRLSMKRVCQRIFLMEP